MQSRKQALSFSKFIVTIECRRGSGIGTFSMSFANSYDNSVSEESFTECGNLTQGMRKVTFIVEIFLRNVTLSRTSIHEIQFWTIFFFCIISSVLE
jgi:hypothetical protein